MATSIKLSVNQKGAVHLLLPGIILVIISLVALGKVQTNTEFGNSDVQGVIAKNNDNKAPELSNRRSPAEEARSKHEGRTSDQKKQEGENEREDETSESADRKEIEATSAGRSISKFPLRIDTSTNQLIMTKNGTERILTTLPSQAVQNMLRAHLKKGLGPKFFQATSSATPSASVATESANITVLENQISLEEINGQRIYKIPAKKHLRLFGFIPVSTDLTGFVSAQTGLLIEERQSLLSRILGLLSP